MNLKLSVILVTTTTGVIVLMVNVVFKLYSQQEGRKITPEDPEEFQLKQEFVRRVTERISLKAEEETQATAAASTSTSAMSLDFVRPVINRLL